MHVESSRLSRARSFELTPAALRRLALAAVVSLYVIVVSGALVRLTGSGLGCEAWPGCQPGAFFPASGSHSLIEFGNRAVAIFPITLTLLAWLGAWRTPELPRFATWVAGLTFLGTIGQAPLGLVTIRFDLHPLLVMAHFLLALVVLAGAIVLALEAWALERGLVRPAPSWVRAGGAVVAASGAVLVVTGTFATAAGPHSGDVDIRRYGNLVDAVYVHVRATAVFGIVFLALLAWLWTRRRQLPRLLGLAGGLLGLLLAQMAVGEIQWRSALPWGVVLLHVALAAAIWAVTVALAYGLWRAPRPLART